MKVDAFLIQLDHPMKESVLLVHERMRTLDPEIGTGIKWNAPNYTYRGEDRVTMRLHRGLFQLILHRGAKPLITDNVIFDDPHGLLKWAAPDRAVIEFTSATDVEARLEKALDTCLRWMRQAT